MKAGRTAPRCSKQLVFLSRWCLSQSHGHKFEWILMYNMLAYTWQVVTGIGSVSWHRASILAKPQRQLPFSQCHFVGFLPSSPSSLILVGGGSNFFHVTFAPWICFYFLPTKCFRANHCKHKCALTKWYIYWNDGFSTEWLADFSLSMTNSHFSKPPNHTLKNIYKMAFCLLIKPGKTHKLLQNGKLDPIYSHHFPQNGAL